MDGPGDAVDRQPGVALEVAEGPRGEVAEDAVDPAGVEAEGAEAPLELGDVVAPEHRAAEVEQPVARAVARPRPGRPRSGGPQTPSTRRPRRYWKASTAARVPAP